MSVTDEPRYDLKQINAMYGEPVRERYQTVQIITKDEYEEVLADINVINNRKKGEYMLYFCNRFWLAWRYEDNKELICAHDFENYIVSKQYGIDHDLQWGD